MLRFISRLLSIRTRRFRFVLPLFAVWGEVGSRSHWLPRRFGIRLLTLPFFYVAVSRKPGAGYVDPITRRSGWTATFAVLPKVSHRYGSCGSDRPLVAAQLRRNGNPDRSIYPGGW